MDHYKHYLMVVKWKPNFCPFMEKVQSMLVLMRFPKLPLELFDEQVLYVMGSTLRRIVCINNTTLMASHGECVIPQLRTM